MRCPKCGFISFDQQPSCSRCGANQTATPPLYEGTGRKTTPPFFLNAALGAAQAEEETPSLDTEVATEEEAKKEGTAALFEALEAESQGIGLMIEEPETEEPTLELAASAAEETAAEEPAITLAETPEEAIALDLGLGEEEGLALELDESAAQVPPEATPAPAPEKTAEPEAAPPEEPPLEFGPGEQAAPPSAGLAEIDLSDLIDTQSAPPSPSRGADDEGEEEIFDLSALMGDHGSDEETSRGDDDPDLAMDLFLDDDRAGQKGELQLELDREEEKPAAEKGKKPPSSSIESSGLSLETDAE